MSASTSEVIAAVQRAKTSAVRPRTVSNLFDASMGAFTAPYTGKAVTSTGAIDRIAKNAIPRSAAEAALR